MSASPALRVVVMADDSAFNRAWLHALEAVTSLHAIVRPVWTEGGAAAPRAAPSLAVRARRRLRARYFAAHDAAAEAALAEALPGVGSPVAPVHEVPVAAINSEATAQQLASWAPDVLLVCGAPLLTARIYRVPRIATLNLHVGIAPNYRGLHTLTVPWTLGDYAALGCTLHHINDGIDRGPVVWRAYPALEPTDTLTRVEARLPALAAREAGAVLRWLVQQGADVLPGQRFTERGRLVGYHDRAIGDDLRRRLRLALGRWPAPPRQTERVERYYLTE